jgi:hypothetical protein
VTRFPGGYINSSSGVLEVAVSTPGPAVLRFSGEHLEELVTAALQAFRGGGGKLFEPPNVCHAAAARRRGRTVLLKSLADGWRFQTPVNTNSEFARGVVAGRLGCAVELEQALEVKNGHG